MSALAEELVGMVPDNVDAENQRVVLVRAGAAWFTDAFFDDSIAKLSTAGIVSGRLLSFAKLREAAGGDVPSPRGVVLHVGRCGSTLLLRMLGRHRGTLPVGEAQAIGNVHRYALRVPEHAPASYQAMADMLVLLDRFAAARGQRPVLKLSSWQTAAVRTLDEMLSATPIVVLHRPPGEVVASELRNLPAWLDWMSSSSERRAMKSWAPRLAALPESATREEIFAATWAATIEAALSLPPDRALFVSYADLVNSGGQILDAIATHIGIADSWDRAAALSELAYYSKSASPDRFDPARRHARPALSPEVLERVTHIAGDLPDRLAERTLKPASTTGETAA
jgi:hypothetical protein